MAAGICSSDFSGEECFLTSIWGGVPPLTPTLAHFQTPTGLPEAPIAVRDQELASLAEDSQVDLVREHLDES